MANLSPSSSCSNRRLSELLEEQQEPFFLDLHLLDKGCSPVLVDAVGGAGSACWPRSRSTSLALRRMAASKETRASGILGLLVSKILRSTTAATANKKKKKLQQTPAAAIDWGTVDGRKTPVNLKSVVPSPPPGAVEAEAEVAVEEEDDDDLSKQLSPVSVLEHRFFQLAPPSFPQKAVVIFRELLESAYTPTLLDQLTRAKEISSSASKDGRIDTSTATTSAPAPAPTRADRTADCEDMCEAELAKVHDLIASDFAVGVKLSLSSDARRDVGVDIAAAVLQALTEEITVELMGMDHDDAMDMMSGRRCWC